MGSWKLLSGTIIEGSDTSVTDYTKDQEFIKIINEDHFGFFRHDLIKGVDSTAIFVSGGGRYTLDGNHYTEYLEYCNYREWEGHQFDFEVELNGDSLIITGKEEVPELDVDRINSETYIRIK